jgi:hypothetical protein
VTYLQLWFKVIVQPTIDWLGSLGMELAASLSDGAVWLSFVAVLIWGGVTLALGVGVGRAVGVIRRDAGIAETLGIGLGLGLTVVAAVWAALRSAGQSSFTPVAIGFLVAIGWSVAAGRRATAVDHDGTGAPDEPSVSRGSWLRALGLAGVFLVLFGLVYGSTMAPSPRDGVQPLESADEAFYSVLGADLADTGVETIFAASGFDHVTGLPRQSWYHWGEIWLAAAVIETAPIGPTFARHYVVLPLLLLAIAALTATVFRRLTGVNSRRWQIASGAAGILLAPMPLILGAFFSWWARGAVFTISQYGLATVIALLAITAFLSRPERPSWPWSLFVGTLAASLISAHLVVMLVGAAGVAGVWVLRSLAHFVRSRRILPVPEEWRRPVAWAAAVGFATLGWGVMTGHGIPATGSSRGIVPYGGFWPESVVTTLVTGGAFLTIPIAWWLGRRKPSAQTWLLLASAIAIAAGAMAWGARLPDYNNFHLFFGAILVFGTSLAVVGTWVVATRLRSGGHRPLATILLMLFGFQIAIGAMAEIQRLRAFGATAENRVPVDLLSEIRLLPPTARLAYSCGPGDEVAPWEPSLISIEAHTGRRLVPMCFEADVLTPLNGGGSSAQGNPLFALAPQKELYPTIDARPEPVEVARFLKAHGIDYIYADQVHANTLVPAAVPVASSDASIVLRIP